MATESPVKGYRCIEKGSEGKEKHRILLVYPKVGAEAKNISIHPPLSLLYLAGYLKDYSVAIFDQRVDDAEKFYALLAERPLCVGFSVMTGVQIRHSLQLARSVKEAGIPTVFGGVHPSIFPEQTKANKYVDYVVAGEGELAFRDIVESFVSGKEVDPVSRNGNVDLNKEAALPYELVNIENYVYTASLEGRSLPFLFSRGCPFACTFCCNPVITKRRWRAMDVDLALRHLDLLIDRYNLDGVFFLDENLTVNPGMLNALARGIGGRVKWMAQSRVNAFLKYDLNFLEVMGLTRISCGIESGSPRMLKNIRKEETVEEYIEVNRRLAKTGISAWYNYLIGFPDETPDDIKSTIRLALQILDENPEANNNTFYILVPYPGTEVAARFLESSMLPGTFEEWSDFGRHNFRAAWHTPGNMKLYERIYFSSKFVGRRISRIFPGDTDLKEVSAAMTEKWRAFEFDDDGEWDRLTDSGWKVLKKLFGQNAY